MRPVSTAICTSVTASAGTSTPTMYQRIASDSTTVAAIRASSMGMPGSDPAARSLFIDRLLLRAVRMWGAIRMISH